MRDQISGRFATYARNCFVTKSTAAALDVQNTCDFSFRRVPFSSAPNQSGCSAKCLPPSISALRKFSYPCPPTSIVMPLYAAIRDRGVSMVPVSDPFDVPLVEMRFAYHRLPCALGSLCVPSPIAMKELWKGWPSIVPRTLTRPRVPKKSTASVSMLPRGCPPVSSQRMNSLYTRQGRPGGLGARCLPSRGSGSYYVVANPRILVSRLRRHKCERTR